MYRLRVNNKGVALFFVLGTLLVVVILANAILAIISSQLRLTHHQVSRIQAYYALQAGMNLAFENLRTGTWTTGAYNLIDPDIPYQVAIQIDAPNPTTGVRTVTLSTDYTYTP